MLTFALLLMAAPPVLEPAPPPKRTATARKRKAVRRAPARPVRIAAVTPQVKAAVAAIDPPNCLLEPLAIGCEVERRNAQYRVPTEIRDYDLKDMAVRETGEQCSLIGQEVCRPPPRKVLTVSGGSVEVATPASETPEPATPRP